MINVAYRIMFYKITTVLNNVIKDILMIHSFANHVFQDAYNATLKILINAQFVVQVIF